MQYFCAPHSTCAQPLPEGPKDKERRKQKDASCTPNPTFRTTIVLRIEVQKIMFEVNSDMIRLGKEASFSTKSLCVLQAERSVYQPKARRPQSYCLKHANAVA